MGVVDGLGSLLLAVPPIEVLAGVEVGLVKVRVCTWWVWYVTVVLGRPAMLRVSVFMWVNTSGVSEDSERSLATLDGRELRELARELGRLLVRLTVLPGLMRSCLGVLGRAPEPGLGVIMFCTSVSGLTRDRGACLQGVGYWVFSRISLIFNLRGMRDFMIGPLAELDEYPLQVEPLATLPVCEVVGLLRATSLAAIMAP